MNTTERIVESYFRICEGCLTTPDVKVVRGNNRQIDLLAQVETSNDEDDALRTLSLIRQFELQTDAPHAR